MGYFIKRFFACQRVFVSYDIRQESGFAFSVKRLFGLRDCDSASRYFGQISVLSIFPTNGFYRCFARFHENISQIFSFEARRIDFHSRHTFFFAGKRDVFKRIFQFSGIERSQLESDYRDRSH